MILCALRRSMPPRVESRACAAKISGSGLLKPPGTPGRSTSVPAARPAHITLREERQARICSRLVATPSCEMGLVTYGVPSRRKASGRAAYSIGRRVSHHTVARHASKPRPQHVVALDPRPCCTTDARSVLCGRLRAHPPPTRRNQSRESAVSAASGWAGSHMTVTVVGRTSWVAWGCWRPKDKTADRTGGW